MEVITLSSDEEEEKIEKEPPKKRAKLIMIDSSTTQKALIDYIPPTSCIELSDDEDSNVKTDKTIEREKTKEVNVDNKGETIENHVNGSCAKNDSEVFILNDKEILPNLSPRPKADSALDIINIEGEQEKEETVSKQPDESEPDKNEKSPEPEPEPQSSNSAIAVVNIDLDADDDDNENKNEKNTETEDSASKNIEVDLADNCEDEDEAIDTKEKQLDACSQEFYVFLDDCLQGIKNREFKNLLHEKLPTVRKYYKKVKHLSYFREEDFLNLVRRCSMRINDVNEVLMGFTEIYSWLRSTYAESKQDSNQASSSGGNQADEKKRRLKIRKLEITLKHIRKKLREFENAEIDWDDDEDSSYIKHDRYSRRAIHIYKKLCELREEDPNKGRLTHMRLDFSASQFTEINRAINKKYKNNSLFPTYFDLDKMIRKCVEKHKLKISEGTLKVEIKKCFEKLGGLLQKRRKMDSYQFLSDFLVDTIDPAEENPEIHEKLKENENVYKKKLDELFEKYSVLQEKGTEEQPLSSDSDDSHYESNDEEENEEVANNGSI